MWLSTEGMVCPLLTKLFAGIEEISALFQTGYLAHMNMCILIHTGPDPLQNSSHIQVYVRRWRPSEFKADPTDEVVVSTTGTKSVEELKWKVGKWAQLLHGCIRSRVSSSFCTSHTAITHLRIYSAGTAEPDLLIAIGINVSLRGFNTLMT